ncbi:MAG TPA: phosphate uptake regulator PhoU [Thermoplasmata archaeon]|nr:phosphate uptake regulator PhoU [Thermoplasmata archaeon]
MELETRKVQKLGYSSVGISLPKAWAASNGLRPGAIITLAVEDDGSLRVRTGPLDDRPITSEAMIDADEWKGPEALTRVITGNYLVGRSTIRVRCRDELSPEQLQEIHEAVRGLTGLTIVNQGPKFVTIENFAEPTRFPIEGLLRRLHYLTSRMENLALGILAGASAGNIEEVIRMEAEVDRLYWLVVRQLLLAAQNRSVAGKIGGGEPRHLLGDRVVAVMLENVGDLWEELATGSMTLLKPTRRIPKEFSKSIATIKGELEKLMELTMTAFFTSNLEKADDALDLKEALEKDLKAFSQSSGLKCNGKGGICSTCTFLRAVLRPIEQVAKYYGTIAQVTINRSLEPGKGEVAVPSAAIPSTAPAAGAD